MSKVTETELQRISLIKKDALEFASYLGELEYQKTILDFQVQDVKSKIKDLRLEETKIFEELRSKYGNININLETGEFTVVQ
jgi:hypothetical protein